jgi:hypothetical protein
VGAGQLLYSNVAGLLGSTALRRSQSRSSPPPPPPVTYSPSHRVLSTPLQALAQARVEAAQLEFRVLELQVGVRAVRYGTVCCGVY